MIVLKVYWIAPRAAASVYSCTNGNARGTHTRTAERYGHRSSLGPYTAKLCRATRVGWFHLSQGIEVSIAAAMLHTRPLTTAPPCCIHFTSSPLSTARTSILEAYSCPDGKRAWTVFRIFVIGVRFFYTARMYRCIRNCWSRIAWQFLCLWRGRGRTQAYFPKNVTGTQNNTINKIVKK